MFAQAHSPSPLTYSLLEQLTIMFCFFNVELLRDGFGEEPYFKVLLVELSSPPADTGNIHPAVPAHTGSLLPSDSMEKNERLVGYSLYFFNYSSCEGRTLFMEDLFIRAEYRSECLWVGGVRMLTEAEPRFTIESSRNRNFAILLHLILGLKVH